MSKFNRHLLKVKIHIYIYLRPYEMFYFSQIQFYFIDLFTKYCVFHFISALNFNGFIKLINQRHLQLIDFIKK